jgi:ABC-type sugar transport system permease subunit
MSAMTSALRRRRHLDVTPYLLVAPAVALILLIYVYPIVRVVIDSFLSPTAARGTSVGLANYTFVLNDPVFWKSAGNNVFLLIGMPVMTILALVIAVILFDQIRGWHPPHPLFTPYILAVPVIGVTFVYLYSYNGIVNEMLRAVGAGGLAKDWLGNPTLVMPSILSVIVYRELGFGVMLFLARMASIREELYEAAMIDGAGWWARLRYITVPQLRTVITFFVVIELITMLSWVFAYVYSMTGGGPAFASSVLELYIWKYAFAYRAIGIASAVAVLLLVATSVFIVVNCSSGGGGTGESERHRGCPDGARPARTGAALLLAFGAVQTALVL